MSTEGAELWREGHNRERDAERQAQLQNIANAGLSPEATQEAIRTLYAKDPSALKQHIENLLGRVAGKKPQPVSMAYPAQTATVQGTPIQVGDVTLPAPQSSVSYPGAKTQAERLSQILSGGKTWAEQQAEVYAARPQMKEYVSPDGKQRQWFNVWDVPQGWQAAAGMPHAAGETSDTRARADFAAFQKEHPEYKETYEQWKTEQAGLGRNASAVKKPVFKTVKGHAVLVDGQTGDILRDLGPVAGVRVTRHEAIQTDADGTPHIVTLTSVSTPEGGQVEVDPEPGGEQVPAGAPAPRKTPSKAAAPPKTEGDKTLPFTKGTPPFNKAQTDYVEAVKLNSIAEQVAQHPDDAVNQKRLAVALERASAGRFTVQALDYIIKAGWGNTLEQWANNPTTGALPADVLRQLVDGAKQNLKASKDAVDALRTPKTPAPQQSASQSTKRHSIQKAMELPVNKGKTRQQVIEDLKAHGYEPVEP